MLALCELIFILALDDDEGELMTSAVNGLETVLAGAVLAELSIQARIKVEMERVIVVDQTPTARSILDLALFTLLDSARPRKVKYWINTLVAKKLVDEIGHYLVEQAVLVRKKKRLHLAIPAEPGPEGYASIKYQSKNLLREIVLTGKQPGLPETVLLAFLACADLHKLVFTSGERKTALKRIRKLVTSETDESLLGETLDAILAAACQHDG